MNRALELNSWLGVVNLSLGQIVMLALGLVLVWLAVKKRYEPLLLVPIGFGILIGNIPPVIIGGKEVFFADVNNPLSPFYWIYQGLLKGVYPALIFLGIGAMTDFSPLLSKPRLFLLGASAQFGIFATLIGALFLGFSPQEAGAIGIIGGADGPTSIFLSSMIAPQLLAPITIAAYSYIALVPVIQPPIMRLLTSSRERKIKMAPPREPSRVARVIFPVAIFLVGSLVAPGAVVLLGMLCVGNLLRESGVTDRLARSARTALVDITTILIGISVGASAQAERFLNLKSLLIFVLGMFAFMFSTASGIIFAKLMNLVSKEKINPLVGAAGVSAVPDSARVAQMVANQEDPSNFILLHAMGPNVAGVIGSAICAGVLWAILY